ncbi:MAG: hypothetical protein M3N97_14850 [Pseudomonadota bacterium]|nr:hypothetical protein [Pseudomonadota bacterium]
MSNLKKTPTRQLRGQVSRGRKSSPPVPGTGQPWNGKEPSGDDLLEMTEEEQISAYQRSPEYAATQKAAPPVPAAAKPEPPKTPGETKKPTPNTFQIDESTVPGKSRAEILSQVVLSPTGNATFSIYQYAGQSIGELDVTALSKLLGDQIDQVRAGDLGRAESMLLSQGFTLDRAFHSLLQSAHGKFGQNLEAAETFLRLAFRAQSQCRATLETLALIKNPKSVAFVRQANIANNQQINNRSRARKKKKAPNKLLEEIHAERLDAPTPPAAKRVDPQVATLDAIDGTQDGDRKGEGRAQRAQGRSHAREAGKPTADAEGLGREDR